LTLSYAPQGPTDSYRSCAFSRRPGYNTKEENWNWFYAIGGYSSWGKGEAVVSDGPSGRQYTLDFEYKFYDRYNWDKGKHVTIFRITITDEFMGEFHRPWLGAGVRLSRVHKETVHLASW